MFYLLPQVQVGRFDRFPCGTHNFYRSQDSFDHFTYRKLIYNYIILGCFPSETDQLHTTNAKSHVKPINENYILVTLFNS